MSEPKKHTLGQLQIFDEGYPDYLDGVRAQYNIREKGYSESPIAYVFDKKWAYFLTASVDMYKALEEIYETFKGRSYSHPRNNNTCGGVTFTYGDMKEVIRVLRKARGEE